MNLLSWLRKQDNRRFQRRRRRFWLAWRLAINTALVEQRRQPDADEESLVQACRETLKQQVQGIFGSLLIALAIELIPIIVKLLIRIWIYSGRQRLDERKFRRICRDVELQIDGELTTAEDAEELHMAVPAGSIPEVLEILSELFDLLARLWDLLDDDEGD